MDECIDSLGDAKIFKTLDCNSGYSQIPVQPEDREKTTFASHEGLYWFLRLHFGLRNAPDTFQCFVDITLSELTCKTSFSTLMILLCSQRLRRSIWRTCMPCYTVSTVQD
jgi:hypothetical protein